MCLIFRECAQRKGCAQPDSAVEFHAEGKMDTSRPVTVRFEGCQPILRVEDMQASLHFYVNQLGFRNAEWGDENFTSVNRDKASIYLCRGGQGRGGTWMWIGVEDAEKLHDELKANGVAIRMPPTNYPWALEVHVEDPDGNVLRLGSEPKGHEGHEETQS
jgi:predicted enzyme related to lactoylglutathione lyase